MQIDVSGFAKVALTFDCQNGSQKRVRQEIYFRKNAARDVPKRQHRAASKLAG
jgi:hypothetical protein